MNDDDWDVYKKIRKDTGDSDSEEEMEKLTEYEATLREHDPSFENEEDKDEISRYLTLVNCKIFCSNYCYPPVLISFLEILRNGTNYT